MVRPQFYDGSRGNTPCSYQEDPMISNHYLNMALAQAQIDERRCDADHERMARRARSGPSSAIGTASRTGWLHHLAHAIMGAAP